MGLNIISCVKSNMVKDDEDGPTFKRYIFFVLRQVIVPDYSVMLKSTSLI
jgi:hypothetical protein